MAMVVSSPRDRRIREGLMLSGASLGGESGCETPVVVGFLS